ncbi:hypothetical protein [Sphingopyxis sp. L1A2A]|uniref:hypothetical protein n=1 Tax=Sphingopyxis sp. L1A2A TaxID=2502247 RepID=UPI0010F9BA9F|nr:hypothetical protein [Sphingopyxis sp. L1A2A]
MGCEIPISKGGQEQNPNTIWTEGQLTRGRFIDAFSRLEGAVTEYLVRLELKAAPRALFSQKLKYLTASRDRFVHPKKLDDRIAAIMTLNDMRSDLAHAVLTVIVQYDETKAIEHWLGFQNASLSDKPLRVVSLDQLRQMTQDANRLATQFTQQQLKATTPAAPASASA